MRELRYWSWILLRIVTVLTMPLPVHADTMGCVLSKLLRQFTRDYTPITHPAVVELEAIQAHSFKVRETLSEMGIIFSKDKGFNTQLHFNSVFGLTQIQGDNPQRYFGDIFVIKEISSSQKKGSYKTLALMHPEMPVYMERLQEIGVEVTVDTSLPFTGAAAYYSMVTRHIGLSPESLWGEFLHEFEHAEFRYALGKSYDRLLSEVTEGRTLKELLPVKTVADLGEKRVARIESLMRQGFSAGASTERLAVDAELRALGIRRFSPFSGAPAERYALSHQIENLEKLEKKGPLTNEQKLQLLQAKSSYEILLAAEVMAEKLYEHKTAATLAGVGGLTLGSFLLEGVKNTKSTVEEKKYPIPPRPLPKNYCQFGWDEAGNLLAVYEDGKIVYVKMKQP